MIDKNEVFIVRLAYSRLGLTSGCLYIRDTTRMRPNMCIFFSVFYVLKLLFFWVLVYFFKVVFCSFWVEDVAIHSVSYY